jgi:uncharacterized protein with HEPN domain
VPFEDPRGRIEDILEAIEKIQRYTRDMSFEMFDRDDMTFDAVVRNFIIVGEAASRLPQELVARYPAVPWHKMRALRNIAVHDYTRVSHSVVWETVNKHLPSLVPQLRQVLEEEP